jgi:nucleoside-diphosphate-sugar epimerase
MKILLTGAYGFLGKYVLDFLRKSNEVISIGRDLNYNIQCDLSLNEPMINESFDWVVHVAGKAHSIPGNGIEKELFHKVNFEGTVNLCNALQKLEKLPKSFIFISTIAVYGLETGENISEDHSLMGNTPYALSKIRAESFLRNWAAENGLNLVILRLPLIVGPNAPGNLGKMIAAIKKGYYLRIGNGMARKSMILATDVAKFIATLEGKSGTYNLTDGIHPSFAELENLLSAKYGKHIWSIPLWLAKLMALPGNFIPIYPLNSKKIEKITYTLTFSDQKAKAELNWNPRSVLGNFDNSYD